MIPMGTENIFATTEDTIVFRTEMQHPYTTLTVIITAGHEDLIIALSVNRNEQYTSNEPK